jgi:hypothetical protein
MAQHGEAATTTGAATACAEPEETNDWFSLTLIRAEMPAIIRAISTCVGYCA